MPQMKAILVEEFGEPEVLRHVEVELPKPGEGEVLIEVRSAEINYADGMQTFFKTPSGGIRTPETRNLSADTISTFRRRAV